MIAGMLSSVPSFAESPIVNGHTSAVLRTMTAAAPASSARTTLDAKLDLPRRQTTTAPLCCSDEKKNEKKIETKRDVKKKKKKMTEK